MENFEREKTNSFGKKWLTERLTSEQMHLQMPFAVFATGCFSSSLVMDLTSGVTKHWFWAKTPGGGHFARRGRVVPGSTCLLQHNSHWGGKKSLGERCWFPTVGQHGCHIDMQQNMWALCALGFVIQQTGCDHQPSSFPKHTTQSGNATHPFCVNDHKKVDCTYKTTRNVIPK